MTLRRIANRSSNLYATARTLSCARTVWHVHCTQVEQGPNQFLRRGPESRIYNAEAQMFSWAVVFFIIAIVAGLFGFVGIAGTATHIAWVLFVIGLILAIVFMVLGRRPPPV